MKIRIEDLGEPDLEFGHGATGKDPKRVLPEAGPFAAALDSGAKTIQLGLVSLPGEVDAVQRWCARMHQLIVSNETNAQRFQEFPGVEKAFRCRLEIPDRFVWRLGL